MTRMEEPSLHFKAAADRSQVTGEDIEAKEKAEAKEAQG
jgi:hypothetical protein